jgi:hypothetical protein
MQKKIPPTEDELEIIKAYQNGVPEYQPVYSQEEVIKELGL